MTGSRSSPNICSNIFRAWLDAQPELMFDFLVSTLQSLPFISVFLLPIPKHRDTTFLCFIEGPSFFHTRWLVQCVMAVLMMWNSFYSKTRLRLGNYFLSECLFFLAKSISAQSHLRFLSLAYPSQAHPLSLAQACTLFPQPSNWAPQSWPCTWRLHPHLAYQRPLHAGVSSVKISVAWVEAASVWSGENAIWTPLRRPGDLGRDTKVCAEVGHCAPEIRILFFSRNCLPLVLRPTLP